VPALHRLRVLRAHDIEMALQRFDDYLRQHSHAVLVALAAADDELSQLEVDVFHAQLQRLLQAKTAAVENRADEPVLVLEPGENSAHFLVRHDDRQPARGLRAHDVLQPRQLQLQYLLVQEQERRQGLVLGGRRNLAGDGQISQERLEFGRAHGPRMPPAMEQYESAYPMQVLLLCAVAVVERAQLVAHLLQQAARAGRRRRGLIRIHAA
jgi:hypothetical protein